MTDAVRESEERAVSSARRKASSIADSADAEGDGTTLARVLVRLRLEAFASQQRDGCAAASSAEAGVLDLTLEPSAPAVEGPSAAGRCQALPASPHAWRDQGLHDSRPEVGLSAHGVRGIEGRGSIDVPEPPAPQVESAFHGNRPVEPAPAPVVTPVEARAPQTAARGGGLIRAVPDRDVQAQVRAPQVHAAAQTDPPSASAVHPASTRSVLEASGMITESVDCIGSLRSMRVAAPVPLGTGPGSPSRGGPRAVPGGAAPGGFAWGDRRGDHGTDAQQSRSGPRAPPHVTWPIALDLCRSPHSTWPTPSVAHCTGWSCASRPC